MEERVLSITSMLLQINNKEEYTGILCQISDAVRKRPQLWAPGYWHLHQENTPASSSSLVQDFWGKTLHHPGLSAPLQLRFGSMQPLAAPKVKIAFKTEKTSNHG